MAEFDRTLRDAKEWRNWDERKSHRYAIVHEARKYPVKQIASLASGVPVSKFSGGGYAGHANRLIEAVGFQVVSLREVNPDWTRDELILALDFYLRHRPNPPSKSSSELVELSRLLQHLGEWLFKPWQRSDTFRNANGVYMKLMNFRRLDPQYTAGGKAGLSAGGHEEQVVWDTFAGNPGVCRKAAPAIASALESAAPAGAIQTDDSNEDLDQAPEGRLLTRHHLSRERNPELAKRKKQKVFKERGKLECEVCGFDFAQRYGSRGLGFIECHHTKPVVSLPEDGKTHLRDLALVCANCHRIIHHASPWLAIADLKKMLVTLHPGHEV